MIKSKDVKVTYHTLVQRMWKKRGKKSEYIPNDIDEDNTELSAEEVRDNPFYLIGEILSYISKLSWKQRTYDLKDGKFCYLDVYSNEAINDQIQIHRCIFESARNEFRPLLINKNTGAKRNNPKLISEGDIERTHALVKIDHNINEVYVFIEKNFYGISIHSFVNYINEFAKKYCLKIKRDKNFSIILFNIPKLEFLTELSMLERTTVAEVYFTKSYLGSKYLNFSGRTAAVKNELVLTARSNPKEDIKELAVDLWNVCNLKDSPISRVRVRGVDPNKNEVLIDTMTSCKTDFIKVDLNQETGEVNSTQLFSGLNDIANSFS